MRPPLWFLPLIMISLDARAQDARGSYFGLFRGELAYENVDVDFAFRSFSENSEQLRLVGGYRFNRQTAIEASWANAPGIDYVYREVMGGAWPEVYDYQVDAEVETLTVRVVGTHRFRHFGLVGGAGYYLADVGGTFRFDWGGYFPQGPFPLDWSPDRFDNRSNRGVTLAGGIQFGLDLGLSLRTEAEYFFTPSGVSLHAINVGLLYRLGRNGRGWQ